TIYELTEKGGAAKTNDIAAKMNLSPASVTEMVQRLAADGYLSYEKYKGVTLTEEGLRIGKRIKRKHRLLERFLADVLGARKEDIHDEACRLEHSISDESERRICLLTNNPKFCPDGDPIPECDDEDCAHCRARCSVPLRELEEGESGEITHLKCENPSYIRRLISMGFVPGRRVRLEERVPMGGPLLIQMEECRIALARDYADLVMVEREHPGGKRRRRQERARGVGSA
ncbi:MAG: metal-dependent transcriptional regulator, partial [Methanomassiliicoccales archaeon]|nr:metal-dependent transcriptional regulator [Methanomassiliicoccales archaeon]